MIIRRLSIQSHDNLGAAVFKLMINSACCIQTQLIVFMPHAGTWDEQKGGWWKADGTEWQRKRIPEPGPPKGPTKWTIAFEEECAAREAREKAVRFDSSTVYCAKHLYTLDNEMCSTCAKRGWRDVRCARHPARRRAPRSS